MLGVFLCMEIPMSSKGAWGRLHLCHHRRGLLMRPKSAASPKLWTALRALSKWAASSMFCMTTFSVSGATGASNKDFSTVKAVQKSSNFCPSSQDLPAESEIVILLKSGHGGPAATNAGTGSPSWGCKELM